MSSAKNLSLRDYEDHTEQKTTKSRNASTSIIIQTAPAADQHNKIQSLEVGAATISDN